MIILLILAFACSDEGSASTLASSEGICGFGYPVEGSAILLTSGCESTLSLVRDGRADLLLPLAITSSAYGWLTDEIAIVNEVRRDPALPGAFLSNRLYTIDISSGTRTEIPLDGPAAFREHPFIAAGSDSVLALVQAPVASEAPTDVGQVDLTDGRISNLTSTPELAEVAFAPWNGGMFLAVSDCPEAPCIGPERIEFMHPDGQRSILSDPMFMVDTLQVSGERLFVGGRALDESIDGQFGVWVADVEESGSLEFSRIYEGPGRWPYVEPEGGSMLLVEVPPSSSGDARLVRVEL
jgi:hypothetical protein